MKHSVTTFSVIFLKPIGINYTSMEQKRIVDVEATEELGELSQGVELKYRIVEVSQHK